ncbi:serine protease grass [Drosophila persimilis]|uniref:serine protease grass n=1 Tax=Drosophila persimilis TaxID=7234 RepID=UPI000F084396|nr:serine protease grass [Drosophila persimilis]
MIGCVSGSLTFCLLAALIGSGLGAEDYPDYCSTFEGWPGWCVHYLECPSINALVQKNLSGHELSKMETDMWNQARCSDRNTTFVCCQDEINASGLEMLTNETECGKFTLFKVTNGQRVKMGSRPWMALLKYNVATMARHQFLCGATLISKRFVLTAAHCSINELPIAVRLGEHDITTDEDCIMVGSKKRCQLPHQDIGIEKIIMHEGYPKNITQNDIALIKLDRDVVYSAHINSICLPLYPSLQKNVLGQTLYLVTGWGRTESGRPSNVPMEAFVKHLSMEDCIKAYRGYAFAENQVCTSAGIQDSCSGDSGGPLQYPFRFYGKQRFVQAGIVSVGSRQCGIETYPSVATNVVVFMPWITKQMAVA